MVPKDKTSDLAGRAPIFPVTPLRQITNCDTMNDACSCDAALTSHHVPFQANWLADPAWRSRRSLLAPSSSGSLESERALSVDSAALSIAAGGKLWGAAAPTPPPPYDEALRAPEMVHRIELNNEVGARRRSGEP